MTPKEGGVGAANRDGANKVEKCWVGGEQHMLMFLQILGGGMDIRDDTSVTSPWYDIYWNI